MLKATSTQEAPARQPRRPSHGNLRPHRRFPAPEAGPGRPPRISDAELITLAIAQALMGLPNDRQFLALAAHRLGHLFPYLPKQSGYSKRLRRLTTRFERCA